MRRDSENRVYVFDYVTVKMKDGAKWIDEFPAPERGIRGSAAAADNWLCTQCLKKT